MRLIHLAAAAALVALAACSDSTGSNSANVDLTTNAAIYNLGNGGVGGGEGSATVTYTLYNSGGADVTVPACGSVPTAELQLQVGGKWTAVAGATSCGTALTPHSLVRGTTLNGSLQVTSVGLYRLKVEFTDVKTAEVDSTHSATFNAF